MLRMLYDNVLQYGDLDRTGDKNLVDDLDLETAVLISIFTERRVESDDEEANTLTYKGGWWGDASGDFIDRIGSRLWRLRRSKATVSNINRAKIYLNECLQWMIDDGVSTRIDVEVERGTTPADLYFEIDIWRPGESTPWSQAWEVQLDAL